MNLQQCFSILAAHWAALNLLIPYPITRNSDLIVLECAWLLGSFRLLGEPKVQSGLRPDPALKDAP